MLGDGPRAPAITRKVVAPNLNCKAYVVESGFLFRLISIFPWFRDPGAGKRAQSGRPHFPRPRGPHPFFWPRLSCKKMPAAFSANWAASPPREDELGEASFFRRKIFAQFKIIQERRSPIQIEARQGFAHIKGVCGWMGMGPRGRGRGRIATP